MFLLMLLSYFISFGNPMRFDENLFSRPYDASNDTIFQLFTRKNAFVPQLLDIDSTRSLTNSNFQIGKPVKIFCSGWNDDSVNILFLAAALKSDDMNVIFVDWTKVSKTTKYYVLFYKFANIGLQLGKFIDWLSTFGVSFKDIHLIGASMGSHIVGSAGRSCKNGRVEYITGMDPPRLFAYPNEDEYVGYKDCPGEINSGDGKYVEIIHSDTNLVGTNSALGTADFYPNGGRFMKGCNDDWCSHARSVEYFIDSIDRQDFKAIECNNYEEILENRCANISTSYMGGLKPKNIHGIFYLETNAERPFYKG